ncbi:hypothetical protein AB0883_02595 [Micromonospora sp. NPDC047812]|uniref:hypothetical protein n=1 Tax=Micromonospora sp. NPDC047812 TaxID=3155742 RepID=UPI003453EA24
MGGLFSELAKQLAERWLSLLVLPGALYLAVAGAAHTLGHAHPFAVGLLVEHITAVASVDGAGAQIALLLATLAGAAVVGAIAQAVGSGIERVVLAADWHDWPTPVRRLAQWAVRRRQRRWEAAARVYLERRTEAARQRGQGEHPDPAPRSDAWRRMTRISAERPGRPTALGDRIHAVATRLDRDLRVDLALVWPYLWLTLPETTRTEITAARQNVTRATVLGAWSVLYLSLTVWWWPAALAALVLAIVAGVRLRSATDTYALLLEAATRLHLGDLTRSLGLDPGGPVTAEVADQTMQLLSPGRRADPRCGTAG